MDLLSNAIESIRTGVADYQQGSHSRLLSAVRDIHAGILLLYKEALRRASPDGSGEVLTKARIIPKRTPDGGIEFVGDGKKTVDIQQIKERFKSLGIASDWNRFDLITETRNDIEHYYSGANKKALEGLIANAFVLARDFITKQLREDPLELLGDDTWQAMLDVSEVYESEVAECRESLQAMEWGTATLTAGVLDLSCSNCGSDLLRPDDDSKIYNYDTVLRCRTCGESMAAEVFVPLAVSTALSFDSYEAIKEGGGAPYTTCPSCFSESYLVDERQCALCGESAEHTCARCSSEIPPEELLSSPYCGYCEYIMNKDD